MITTGGTGPEEPPLRFIELLLRGAAWASLLAWTASECLGSTAAPGSARERRARALHTAGILALLAHSALAFHVRYGWSHEAAARDAAGQIAALTGLDFRGGLFVNYLFLLLWSWEAIWWWRAPVSYRRRGARLDGSVRAFFLLMFVNGAVVFARGPVRLVGSVATVAVAWVWYRRARGEVAHG